MHTNKVYNNYFELRNVDKNFYKEFKLPHYLINILPPDKKSIILDIGCGFGQVLLKIKELGYNNIKGIDVSESAIEVCKENGLNVEKIDDLIIYCSEYKERFDFILMSHVLEHLPKEKTIETLTRIKSILNKGGKFCVLVPNAQSNTGCYWAYEDFTHYTLFTAGSLYYVLKAAGFKNIIFLDPKGVEGSSLIIKIIKLSFLAIYSISKDFWNKITSSSFHKPSPKIFTYELKVLASND